MKKVKIFAVSILAVLMLGTTIPALAAPPPDNPGKGPAEIGKKVFIHYKNGVSLVKPATQLGKPTKEDVGPYSYSGIHWADWSIPVTYYINKAGTPGTGATLEDTVAGVNAAFSTWEVDSRSYIDFNYGGTTELLPDTDLYDGYNVIGWGDLSDYPGAIAVTTTWYLQGSGWIVDCDVVLSNDSDLVWTQADIGDADPDTAPLINGLGYDVDIQNIMTHEAGHWLQLNDLYETDAQEQTMYGYAGDGELKKRSLESGDEAGVRKIYPQRGKKR